MKIRSRLLTKGIAALGVAAVRALFATCRVQVIMDVPGVSPYVSTGDRRFLYCIWHDQLLMTIFSGRPQQMAGLVSQHQDGSYLADAMKMVGITAIRGSTNRGGARAMREMLEAADKLHIAITPDGPRGPRHELKAGLVFLAAHSGRAIIPTAYTCRRCWRVQGSWTDMMIPKPFTEIFVRSGAPFQVPAKASREELEQYRRKLQAEMERLEADALCLARGEEPPPREMRSAA